MRRAVGVVVCGDISRAVLCSGDRSDEAGSASTTCPDDSGSSCASTCSCPASATKRTVHSSSGVCYTCASSSSFSACSCKCADGYAGARCEFAPAYAYGGAAADAGVAATYGRVFVRDAAKAQCSGKPVYTSEQNWTLYHPTGYSMWMVSDGVYAAGCKPSGAVASKGSCATPGACGALQKAAAGGKWLDIGGAWTVETCAGVCGPHGSPDGAPP